MVPAHWPSATPRNAAGSRDQSLPVYNRAVSGFAYVFSVPQADGVHYGAVRVAYVARDYVVLDWSYQSRAGSAELFRL